MKRWLKLIRLRIYRTFVPKVTLVREQSYNNSDGESWRKVTRRVIL